MKLEQVTLPHSDRLRSSRRVEAATAGGACRLAQISLPGERLAATCDWQPDIGILAAFRHVVLDVKPGPAAPAAGDKSPDRLVPALTVIRVWSCACTHCRQD